MPATYRRTSSAWKTLRGNTTSNNLRTCETVSAGAFFPNLSWRCQRKKWANIHVTRLGRLTVLGNVLCWHQDPQNVLTAVALGEQLFDELEQTLQRVTSYRMHLLSDGDGALCERKPFCFRP